MNFWLVLAGLIAGLLSGSVGFGGGMVLLPVVTYFFGIETAVPLCTIAQMLSNLSKMGFGWKCIRWKAAGQFLITAVPLTALGAIGFAFADKVLMTRILAVFLTVFAVMKLLGKMRLPHKPAAMLVGGGITGFVNGLMGISGPLSSAVFLTLDLAPVAYIASEATAAATMHVVKTLVYGKLNLLTWSGLLDGVAIGIAMMAGNYFAMKFIGKLKNKTYQKIVAFCMIVLSIWLFVSA